MKTSWWMLDGWVLVRHNKQSGYIGVTIYKPSEWVYLFTGYMPESWYNYLDEFRWLLEKCGL